MRAPGDALPRGAYTVLLLGMALAASLLLAWQANSAAASHRAASEAVLRDYAGLAASELMRRGASEVGYRGHYVLVQSFGSPGRLPGAPAGGGNAKSHRAAALVRRTFSVDLTSRRVAFNGDDDPAVAAWLAEHAAPPPDRGPYAVVHAVVAGQARSFVFVTQHEGRLAGYEVETRALAPFIAAAVDEGPLLPDSLGHGRVGNDRLALVVRDAQGVVVFRRVPPWSGSLRAVVVGDDAYSGALRGFSAEVEIDPSAAPDLVIGGLPRSRLAQILALVGLAAGLLVVTLVQLGRERALERLRAEFVASASHELRTPLTQLRMFAETLRLGRVRSEEERQRSLDVIDREARRLAHLVENLLQFSRSGRGAPGPDSPPRELGPLVAEVLESFRPVAESTGARLRAEIAPDLWARVDADAWRQVLLNLLDNAAKYGPPGQEIAICLDGADGQLRLSVEDQGPGIPASERERVFERFQRLERDRASTVTGTGLGLAVVRRLVSGWGGRCFVEAASGGGARVVVELKATPAGPS